MFKEICCNVIRLLVELIDEVLDLVELIDEVDWWRWVAIIMFACLLSNNVQTPPPSPPHTTLPHPAHQVAGNCQGTRVWYLNAQDGQGDHCFSSEGKENDDQTVQLHTPLIGVYRACTGKESIYLSYNSYQFSKSANVAGSGAVGWLLQPYVCEDVTNAIGISQMTLTEVMFHPFFGGAGGGSQPASTAHEVSCSNSGSLVSLHAGSFSYCYAGKGEVDVHIAGVTAICGSSQISGSVSFSTRTLDGVDLDVSKGDSCAEVQDLFPGVSNLPLVTSVYLDEA